MKLYCDMDFVLVQQTGRDGFDTMPWMPDGKALWNYIKPLHPTILSQLSPDIFDRGSAQKRVWCTRELGRNVPLIVVKGGRDMSMKYKFSEPGSILIDDGAKQHEQLWVDQGGMFIHHLGADSSITRLKDILYLMRERA